MWVLELTLFGTLCPSFIWMFVSFPMLGKLPAIISWNNFSRNFLSFCLPLSFCLFLWIFTLLMWILIHLILLYNFLYLCFFILLFFILAAWSEIWCLVFKFKILVSWSLFLLCLVCYWTSLVHFSVYLLYSSVLWCLHGIFLYCLSLCWWSPCGHLFFSRVSWTIIWPLISWPFCWTLYGVLTYLCFIHFFFTFYIDLHALDKIAASASLERVVLSRRWILLLYHALTFFSQTCMITNAVILS